MRLETETGTRHLPPSIAFDTRANSQTRGREATPSKPNPRKHRFCSRSRVHRRGGSRHCALCVVLLHPPRAIRPRCPLPCSLPPAPPPCRRPPPLPSAATSTYRRCGCRISPAASCRACSPRFFRAQTACRAQTQASSESNPDKSSCALRPPPTHERATRSWQRHSPHSM